jgi:hypothetical protein
MMLQSLSAGGKSQDHSIDGKRRIQEKGLPWPRFSRGDWSPA